MPKLTLQVRTHDNLLELLAKGQTHAWIVAEDKVQRITHVQVVNFEGTQMIEGVFDRNSSYYTTEYTPESRLVVKFMDGHIVNCKVQFKGQNPVHYIEE